MGWFTEQIKQREESDQNLLEDSFFRMASAVMDKWDADRLADERLIAKEAMDGILKFYHQKPVEIPENIKDAKRSAGICASSNGSDDPGRGIGG